MCRSLWMWSSVLLFILLGFNASNGPDLVQYDNKQPELVCVIGAGYSGLATARYLQQYGLNFMVFEATRHIGGTWRFDPHIGQDEDGVPVYTSMYKRLRTNAPRQTMEFAGFSMPEDTATFPTGECFYKYIENFAKHFNLWKYIQLRSMVTLVSWAEDHWNLIYTKTDSKTSHQVSCDFVVVANAQRYSLPNQPYFRGIEQFQGTKIHSHDYKDSFAYVNRKVLVVGAGPSGLDLAVILSRVASKLVHSHHRNLTFTFPTNYIKKPDVDSFTTNGVLFQDGSFEELDDIIFATGYLMNHPFLDKSSGVIADTKFVMPLYQHIVNIVHPSMAFVGLARQAFPRIFDTQAEYVAALVAKSFELPSQEEMMKSWLRHMSLVLDSGKKLHDVNLINNEIENYYRSLSREARVTKTPSVLFKMRMFNMKNRLEDWLRFRDYDFEIIDEQNFTRRYNPRQSYDCDIKA